MATYRLLYQDDDGENRVEEVLEGVTGVDREDGWVVIWRGREVVQRLREQHVVRLDEMA